ncbi:hypothetical protein [Streptomyces umbrinus]|uniref:hypothetical protein n=1 Tax=Streptomyces umbrinus TaxID=67370 RepID=UPI003C2BFEA7
MTEATPEEPPVTNPNPQPENPPEEPPAPDPEPDPEPEEPPAVCPLYPRDNSITCELDPGHNVRMIHRRSLGPDQPYYEWE